MLAGLMAGCQEPGDLSELAGTVKPYGRHALACAGWTTWKERIEEQDDLLGLMGRQVKELKGQVDPPTKFTALRTEPAGQGVDLLIFPDALVYRGVTEDTWPRILDEHLAQGTSVDELAPEHCVLLHQDADTVAARLTGPACVVAGQRPRVPQADYAAGPSHVLPTGGHAAAYSGISTATFTKRVHVVHMDEADEVLEQAAIHLARLEGLEGHARAIEEGGP
jgi:hypothetical protein